MCTIRTRPGALLVRAETKLKLSDKTNGALNVINTWMKKHYFKNRTRKKSEAIFLTDKKSNGEIHFSVGGLPIDMNHMAKYLKVILDTKVPVMVRGNYASGKVSKFGTAHA